VEFDMADTPNVRNILVVVDPSQPSNLALERAVATAGLVKGNSVQVNMHILIAVDADNTDTSADNASLYRTGAWFFERIVGPLQEAGVAFTVEMCWSTDWYGSIMKSAVANKATVIMLPMLHKPSSRDRLFNESIWRLLRTARIPVLIVQRETDGNRKTVLASVNEQSTGEDYQQLNDLIIERSRWIAGMHGSELHLVNAYATSLDYPDRGYLLQKTGIASANIHLLAGEPEDVIAKVAEDIDCDILVIGARARTNRWRGNTAERIITKVNSDILVINQPE